MTPRKEQLISNEELRERYPRESMQEIAKSVGVGRETVSRWIASAGIVVDQRKKPLLSEEELRERYPKESIRAIAKSCGAGPVAVRRWIADAGIVIGVRESRRARMKTGKLTDREIVAMYVKEKKTISDIARAAEVSTGLITFRLQKAGARLRGRVGRKCPVSNRKLLAIYGRVGSVRGVASELGATPYYAKKWLKNAGATVPRSDTGRESRLRLLG
ncbi:hypothetical protein AB0C28_07045 [Nonomuraea sp. NPDC048892]|uniref:hypothetical protein n=1 Tax=Nonomuraea sp. NPDC048892 TaxID=3154624 RepID=UPI0033C20425